MLFFTVRDDGRGMGHPAGRGDRGNDCPIGLGVPGMYARVGQLGGTLRILSGARGTTLSGKLPLRRCAA
jgi:signal transduction histidine kinase